MNRLNRLERSHILKKEFDEVPDEELNRDSHLIKQDLSNFKSELDYDGYRSIEDADNAAYGSDVEGYSDPEKELNFDDREEGPDLGEENLIDPQENQRPTFSKEV